MNGLRRELGVATRTGVAISALVAVLGALLLFLATGDSPLTVRVGFSAAMGLFLFVYGFLVSYVHGDAKRRGMRAGVWALVAATLPNAIGLIAYFLLREPLLQPCRTCGAAARRDHAFCPQCGAPLPGTCAGCRRPVQAAWNHCAHCGTSLLRGTSS